MKLGVNYTLSAVRNQRGKSRFRKGVKAGSLRTSPISSPRRDNQHRFVRADGIHPTMNFRSTSPSSANCLTHFLRAAAERGAYGRRAAPQSIPTRPIIAFQHDQFSSERRRSTKRFASSCHRPAALKSFFAQHSHILAKCFGSKLYQVPMPPENTFPYASAQQSCSSRPAKKMASLPNRRFMRCTA